MYIYLSSVFAVIMRWRRLNCAVKNSKAALRLRPNPPQMKPEPFAIVIFCTADPKIVDAKTRSKWSRVLRYAARTKPEGQRLIDFIKSNGGLNECARKFARIAGKLKRYLIYYFIKNDKGKGSIVVDSEDSKARVQANRFERIRVDTYNLENRPPLEAFRKMAAFTRGARPTRWSGLPVAITSSCDCKAIRSDPHLFFSPDGRRQEDGEMAYYADIYIHMRLFPSQPARRLVIVQ